MQGAKRAARYRCVRIKSEPGTTSSSLPVLLFLLMLLLMMSGCAFFSPPVPLPPDPVAEAIIRDLQETNAHLFQFKGIGQIRIFLPEEPVQVFRVAIAGQMTDHLRIDLLSPVGGSAATFSSNGRHVFLIRQTPPVEYHKKKARSGLLRRLTGIDIEVSDLLELIVGRIPVAPECTAHMAADGISSGEAVELVDKKGRVRQRIVVAADGKPVEAVWFDTGQKPVYTVHRLGEKNVSGFVFPQRIELFTPDEHRLVVSLDRYFPDAPMDVDLFNPPPPPALP